MNRVLHGEVLYRMLRDARHRRRTARANYTQMEEYSEHLKIVRAFAASNVGVGCGISVHSHQSIGRGIGAERFGKKDIEADLAESVLQSPRVSAGSAAG